MLTATVRPGTFVSRRTCARKASSESLNPPSSVRRAALLVTGRLSTLRDLGVEEHLVPYLPRAFVLAQHDQRVGDVVPELRTFDLLGQLSNANIRVDVVGADEMDTEELAPQLVVQIELMEHLAGRLVRRRAFVDEFRSRLRISAVLSRDVGFERLAHHVGHPAGIRGRFAHPMLHEPRRDRFRNGSASVAITPGSREMPL